MSASFQNTQGVTVDDSSHAIVAVSIEHHEIHEGDSFSVHINNTTANTDDHRTLMGFETPSGLKAPHLVVTANASAAAEVFLYETVTIDDDEGLELDIECRNRILDNTSMLLSFENPAVAGLVTWMLEAEIAAANFSATTILFHETLVAGTGPKPIGGDTRGSQEWLLKPATKYAVVVQNIGANINVHGITLNWYERTPKE